MRDWLTHRPYIVRQSWPGMGFAFFPSGRMNTKSRLIVIHSTETTGFPGYNRGAANPHFTIDLRTGEVRQHVPLSYGSRCLAVSAGGIVDRTVNITGTIQIEVIGAVTPGYPNRYGHYDLPRAFPGDARAQGFLARLLRDIHDETGIPLQTSDYTNGKWVAYPGSYGARARQRLSSAAFRDAMGVVGHQHAPANDHGDGLLGRAVGGQAVDLEKVLTMARTGTKPAPVPPKPDYSNVPRPENNFFFPESQVRDWQKMINGLAEAGLVELLQGPLKVDGRLAGRTMTATRKWQVTLGFKPEDQDGLPGPRTQKATGDAMKELLEELRALRATVEERPTLKEMRRDASMGFAAEYHGRLGYVPNPDHAAFPADRGSLAWMLMTVYARTGDGTVPVHTAEHGTVFVRYDEDEDTFVLVEEV